MFGGLMISSPVGTITALSCGTATNNGTITSGTVSSGVSSLIPYTGGNGGTHAGQVVTSTGVTGLTATLTASTFAIGAGSLTYTITGIPASSGTASFAITVGGQSCSFTLSAVAAFGTFPVGTVNCAGATAVINVTNYTTGKIWMDRNLGASQVATSSTDVASYGDLYQWGRRADGHQCRTSATTATLSSIDQPAHGNFIISSNEWRSPENTNLWQGVNGVNNPCPSGYRLPTDAELISERQSWSSQNAAGAFASRLKLPFSGKRSNIDGSITSFVGQYWSSTVMPNVVNSYTLRFITGVAIVYPHGYRAEGSSVRCLKN
jgi:uncharacterized protein (TIGR02145 family)